MTTYELTENHTALDTNNIMFGCLPDGSLLDYNRIHDVIDEVFATKKIAYKDAERFMYQYQDALRNYEMIMDRYAYVIAPLSCYESRFMRDPSRRYFAALANETEYLEMKPILTTSEIECDRAKTNVCRMIHLLEKDTWKTVMAAHYLCMADWHKISRVYGHQDRWAKDVHNKAMAIIEQALQNGYTYQPDKTAVREAEDWILKWKADEHKFDTAEEIRYYDMEDLRWILNLE